MNDDNTDNRKPRLHEVTEIYGGGLKRVYVDRKLIAIAPDPRRDPTRKLTVEFP